MKPPVLHTQPSINNATYFKQLTVSLNKTLKKPEPSASLLGYDVIVIWQKFPHISEAVEPLFCSV